MNGSKTTRTFGPLSFSDVIWFALGQAASLLDRFNWWYWRAAHHAGRHNPACDARCWTDVKGLSDSVSDGVTSAVR